MLSFLRKCQTKRIFYSLLAIVFVVLALFTLSACKDDPKGQDDENVEVTGIEIQKLPDKVNYFVGDVFDSTGMVVVKVLSNGKKEQITDYTISKTGPLTITDTEITIKYGKYEAKIIISVTIPELENLEFAIDEGYSYIRTMDFSSFIKYRGVLTNGTYTAWSYIVRDDVKDYRIENDKLVVDVEVSFNNKIYTTELEIPISNDYITVSELKKQQLNNETYVVEGIIVAMGTTMSQQEFILWDEVSGEYIGVTKLSSGAILDYELDTNGFKVGDKIRIPVSLTQAVENELNSNSTKVFAQYVGGSEYQTAIISRNHKHTFNKQNVITISTQEQLIDFLKHDNRRNNFYTMVRLVGEMRFAYYSGAQAYRLYFDSAIKSLNAQLIDNASPVFINVNQYYTTGKRASELLFGQEEGYSPTFASPAVITKEIYALFIGGNTYYHHFIILSENDINGDVQPREIGKEFVVPQQTIYYVNDTLNLTGGKIIVKYDFGSNTLVDLTLEMLDQESLPDFSQAGKYVVTGSYEGYEFSFEIEVIDAKVESLSLNGTLEKSHFSHRDKLIDDVLAQLLDMQIIVHYNDGNQRTVNIIENMVTLVGDWKIGENTFRISYLDKYVDVTVTVENTAISVSEFLQKEHGEVADVHGIIIGPANSQAMIELLMMDKVTGQIIGIANTGIVGTISNPTLDTNYLNPGDEVIVTLEVMVRDNSVNVGKKLATAVGLNDVNFKNSIIVLSTGNELKVSIQEMIKKGIEITTISNQQELVNFVTSDDRFYKIVKLEGPIYAAVYSGSSDPTNKFYRIYFDKDITALSQQSIEVNGISASPVIHNRTTNYYYEDTLESLFTPTHLDGTTINFTSPAICYHNLYALFVGGNNYYHIFTIIDPSWIEFTQPTEVSKEFVAPQKTLYKVAEMLDLTGGKVVVKYNFGPNKEVDLTLDMLDQDAIPNMNEVGKYLITGSYEGFEFSFEIEVLGKEVESITLDESLEKATFGHRDNLFEEVLAQLIKMQITVHYDNGDQQKVDIDELMVAMMNDWQIGENTFRITYLDKYVDVTVTVENRAISVSEFLQKNHGEVYDVHGIIVGPANSQGMIELLMMDKVTGQIVGIANTGVVGSTGEPTLDTNYFNQGDEVIVTLEVMVRDKSVNIDKKMGTGEKLNAENFKKSIILLSTGNPLKVSVDDLLEYEVEITTISNQQELVNFIQSSDRFYKIVKFVGPIYAAQYNTFYRIFLDPSIKDLASQRVEVNGISASPVIHNTNTKFYYEAGLESIFTITNPDGKTFDFKTPAVCENYNIYAIFVGGNDYYHIFTIIDPSWIEFVGANE